MPNKDGFSPDWHFQSESDDAFTQNKLSIPGVGFSANLEVASPASKDHIKACSREWQRWVEVLTGSHFIENTPVAMVQGGLTGSYSGKIIRDADQAEADPGRSFSAEERPIQAKSPETEQDPAAVRKMVRVARVPSRIASNLYALGANEKTVQSTKERYIKTFDPSVLEAMERLQATVEVLESVSSNWPAGANKAHAKLLIENRGEMAERLKAAVC